jgi:hypothetical protein
VGAAAPMPGLDDDQATGYNFHWVFQLAAINFMPDGILAFLIRPVAPERRGSTFVWDTGA